jgi:hypothetical protein
MSIVVILLGIGFIAAGYFQYKKPESFWEWNEGWKVKGDSEPSEVYIMWTKQTGIVAAIVGFFFFAGGLIALFT